MAVVRYTQVHNFLSAFAETCAFTSVICAFTSVILMSSLNGTKLQRESVLER